MINNRDIFISHNWLNPLKAITTILIFSFSALLGLNAQRDSLLHQLSIATADSVKVDLQLELSKYYADKQKDSSLYYAQQSLALSEEMNDLKRIAHSYYAIAYAYDFDAQLERALEYYEKARIAFNDIGDTYWTSVAMNGKGVACYFQGNYGQAMEYYLEALDYQKTHSLKEPEANTLNNIGVLYRLNEKYDEALEIYEQNLQIRKELKDSSIMGRVYNNIGVVYTYMNDIPKSIEYLDSAKMIYTALNDTITLAGILLSLGDALTHEGEDYDRAYAVLKEGYDFMKVYDDHIFQSRALLYIGRVEVLRNRSNSAIAYYKEGLRQLEETELNDIKKDIHLELANVQSDIGALSESNANLKAYVRLNDTLASQQKLKYIEEMQSKYESQKKESEIDKLNNEKAITDLRLRNSKLFNYSLGIGALLLSGLSFFLFKLYRKNKNLIEQLKSTQDKVIASEKLASMNQLTAGLAHELNNPINYIYNNAVALEMDTDELKPLFKHLMEIQKGKEIDIHELQSTTQNINLWQINEEIEKLIASIKNGSDRVQEIVKNLRLITQPSSEAMQPINANDLIIYAVEKLNNDHGERVTINSTLRDIPQIIGSSDQLGVCLIHVLNNALEAVEKDILIEINTKHQNDHITISVKDNGRGMSKEALKNIFQPFYTTKDVGEGVGLGLSICHGIISNHNGSISVESELGEGTTVTISLPT